MAVEVGGFGIVAVRLGLVVEIGALVFVAVSVGVSIKSDPLGFVTKRVGVTVSAGVLDVIGESVEIAVPTVSVRVGVWSITLAGGVSRNELRRATRPIIVNTTNTKPAANAIRRKLGLASIVLSFPTGILLTG
jgi:hypothetical protein